jgi:trimeric autotransporter adhesin
VNNLSKSRCLLYIIAALFLTLTVLMSGCGGQDATEDVQSTSSNIFRGYVFAPSSLPSVLSSRDYQGDKLIVLTDSKPPSGYIPVERAVISSVFEPERVLAVSDASGMFQLDLNYMNTSRNIADTSSGTIKNLIVFPPDSPDGEFMEKTVLNASNLMTRSEGIIKLLIDPSTRIIFEKETAQLRAMAITQSGVTRTINPSEVTWSVSNGNAASVTPSGVITGIKPGSVKVTISYQGVTSTGTVHVIKGQDWCMLNGTLLDENGKAVRGAVVTIEEVEGVDVTNAAGNFLIKKIPTNINLTLTVSIQGITRYTEVINVTKTMNFITIKLPGEQQPQKGNIEGTVTSGGKPIQGVTVSAESFSDITDINGKYRIKDLSPQTYTFTFEKDGYEAVESPKTIIAGETVVLNVELLQILQPTTGTLAGYIVDHTGKAITGAAVSYSANNQFPGEGATTTDTEGFFSFNEVPEGTYRLRADQTGYNAGYTDAAVIAGKTTLTEIVLHSLASIQVSPVNPSVANGYSVQFYAAGIYTDNSSRDLTGDVTWISSNTHVALISNETIDKGLAKTKTTGTTDITAELQGVVSTQAVLMVTAAELVSIQVTPANTSVAKGYNRQFTATGLYTDNSTKDITSEVTWHSSNIEVAIISNHVGSQGLAISVATGVTEIKALYNEVTSPTAELTVTPAELVSIQVDPPAPTVAKGFDIQFTATGIFSDNSAKDITDVVNWISSDESVANISNLDETKGLASTWMTGETEITASANGITSPAVKLTVTPAVLLSLQVEPVNPSVAKGYDCQFSATGMYSDMTTKDMTTDVTWFSSAPDVAAISNSTDSKGLAVTLKTGTTQITASLDGVTSPISTLTVTPAVLTSLQVEPVNPSVAKGYSCQFNVTGTYSDMTTKDLTADVTWFSSDPKIASISNAEGSKGLASSAGIGTTEITAVKNSITSLPVILTVTPAELLSLNVEPQASFTALGYKQQFVAFGTYSDNTVKNITNDTTWFSSNTAVASISNLEGSKGLVTTLKEGTTGITAVLGSIESQTAEFTVTPAVLETINISPGNTSLVKGFSLQFTAEGTYSDGTVSELTDSVTWISSFPDIALISNSAGTKGLAVSAGEGDTDIIAILGEITSPVSILTVTPAELVSMKITPVEQTMGANGKVQQFNAKGTFTDQTEKDITNEVTWTSFDTNVASISNNTTTKGLATSTGKGVTTIKAVYPSTDIQATALLSVETPKWLLNVGRTAYSSSSPAIAEDGTIYVGSSNLKSC